MTVLMLVTQAPPGNRPLAAESASGGTGRDKALTVQYGFSGFLVALVEGKRPLTKRGRVVTDDTRACHASQIPCATMAAALLHRHEVGHLCMLVGSFLTGSSVARPTW
eukprot:scaffold2827_cov409-Prasinococcus_capsulatus_cf.AAC.1